MYIDTHVHLRDFNQAHKETIKHGLEVARDSGLDAIFDMPNTDPPILNRDVVLERLAKAKDADVPEVFYGLYMGLTKDMEQVKRAVALTQEFSQVIGMKLYAGHSVGQLGVIHTEDQEKIYQTLVSQGYKGVLVIHAEKEEEIRSNLWNHSHPISHCYARSEHAETASIADQLKFAWQSEFSGTQHIAHISTPKGVELVSKAKEKGMKVTCGICPHHFIYDWTKMETEDGLLWKMNPPLRSPKSREQMLNYLKAGKIDWIETDHAPHTLKDKLEHPFMSGIPGLAWWPLFEEYLRRENCSDKLIEDITFGNIQKTFGLDIDKKKRSLKDRRQEYPFNPYTPIEKILEWNKSK